MGAVWGHFVAWPKTRAHPSVNSSDLMGWEQIKGCQNVNTATDEADSATDGDLDTR